MSTESTAQAPARSSSSSRPRLIPAADFSPSPELAEKLLSQLADPDFNLGALAELNRTSLESLCLWLTRPDIAARIANIETVMAMKVRLDVACYVPLIIHSCKTTLAFYAEALNHRHISDHDNRGHSIRARQGHTAMMASRILLHLAKHYAKPAQPPRQPRDPAPFSPNSPAPTNTPSDPNTAAERTARFDLLPPLADITNLHDERAANRTTSPNPTRDNAHDSASTSPSRERRSDASASAHAMGDRWLPDAPASGTTPAPSQAHEMGDRSACTPTTTPLTDIPETPGKSPCACHSKRKSKSCGACTSHTPTTLLISAGTTTPRKREHPKPSR